MRRTYTGKLIQADYWGIPKVELQLEKEIILAESIFDEFLGKDVVITINDEMERDYTLKELLACLDGD